MQSETQKPNTGKASLAAKFFQKLLEKRRAIKKHFFNALKTCFYRYKTR